MTEITEKTTDIKPDIKPDIKKIIVALILMFIVVGGLFYMLERMRISSSQALLAINLSYVKDAESLPDSPEKTAFIDAVNKAAADGVMTKEEHTVIKGRKAEFKALTSNE